MNSAFLSRCSFVVLAALLSILSNLADALGPASKRTALVISEVMYHPLERADGRNLEYIEIFNSDSVFKNLSGYRLEGDISYKFPEGTVLPGLGFIVVARNPADVQSVYSITGAHGPFAQTNNLPNDSGRIELWSKSGGLLLEVDYSDNHPWPAAADGAGHSLVLNRPTYGQNNVQAWAPSSRMGGSPGAHESTSTDAFSRIVINEILAHTDLPSLDYLELHNPSSVAVNLQGCILTDNPDTNKFIIGNVTIPARGYAYFTETTLGFRFSAAGETILLKNPSNTRVIDAIRFGGQENSIAFGRFPDGSPEWYPLISQTPGGANTAIRQSSIVINELMYSPISRDDDEQFVELFNTTAAPINLSGWSLSGGINYTIPTNTVIGANDYLVIAKSAARILLNYTNLTAAKVIGDFSGRLAGSGERIVLNKPDTLLEIEGEITFRIPVDEVTYGTGGRWDEWADGGGSSLELIDHRANHRLASSWAASDETRKAPWTLVEHTGTLDNGTGAADQFQMILQGPGEALIDDIEVFAPGGGNLIANSDFQFGANGWTALGTQDQSTTQDNEGYNSTRSFRIRAADRGDTGANRIRTPLSTPLTAGGTATIRARMRWLRGHPEALLRIRGNYLEAIGRLIVPKNLGTPGARNSRALNNTGPAIYAVSHSPVLPAAGQLITVTARVHDSDPLALVQLVYRTENPIGAAVTLTMNDNGTAGDSAANDGIFSAQIPGLSSATMVAFYIRATDNAAAVSLFPSEAPTRECLVRVGESQPGGPIGTYRIWMTQATQSRWATRGPLDNTPLDVTFVYNNERVIYNLKALYAGSPYIAPGYSGPTSGLCGYTGEFPKDDLFLGVNDFVLDWPGRDPSAVAEQMSYIMADNMGLPNSHRRFIHLHVNGVNEQTRGSIYEDVQQPGGDMIKQWSANDTEGHFYKIERWFEFNDNTPPGRIADPQPRLQNYTTTGGAKKLARYRWNWLPRAITKSANDYDDIFAWVDAVNAPAPEPYTSQTEALADMEEIMGMFAIERIISNFDSWGHAIGKNMYAYKPVDGRWITFMFDNDWLMTASSANNEAAYGVNSALFTPVEDPTVARMYSHPPFRRAYFRAIKKGVDVMDPTILHPVMDAKYAMLQASGVTRSANNNLTDPTPIKNWLAARRAFLVTQLATLNVPFAITSNGGADFSSTTNVVTLTGTAPIDAAKIAVNGSLFPVQWTTPTNFSIRFPLSAQSTVAQLQAVSPDGTILSNFTDSVTITYQGTLETPVGNVVFNEIMYNPLTPATSFLELRSLAASTTFDLSNWRLDGVGFTFPSGTILPPGGFLTLVKDRAAFTAKYGNTIAITGEFPGQLQNDGETLRLFQPGPTPGTEILIDSVTYSDKLPWPAAADGQGGSLQLIDARQDNNRALNWAAFTPVPNSETQKLLVPITQVWKYDQSGVELPSNWTATNFNDSLWPSGGGLLYVESSALPAPKTTPLTGGRITYYFRTGFNFSGDVSKVALNVSTVVDDGVVIYLNGQELYRVAVNDPVRYTNFSTRLVDNAAYEGPFIQPATWLRQGTNTLAAEVHQENAGSTDIVFGMVLESVPLAPPVATPGTANSVARNLPTFPSVWINEIMPVNVSSITDEFGQRRPWIELYNSGSNNVSLAGWYLTDNMSNLTRWPFPSTTTINAGQRLLVWLDGQNTALHANFIAPPQSGSVALVGPFDGAPRVIDFVTYTGVPNDRSLGRFPEATGAVELFFQATPGAANNNSAPSLPLFINEWMASNSIIRDPSDNDFDDWIEIYNPNNVPVDLTGYGLSDNLTDVQGRWLIPGGGWIIPANGYILIWADEESPTNATQLHADFRLGASGESIGLYAPNGSLVDSVTFGAQTNNISQGRWTDGGAEFRYFTTATPGGSNAGQTNLQLEPLTISANNITLRWTAQANSTYRVQYKRDLNNPDWIDLSNVAGGQFNEPLPTHEQRYYRVIIP